MLTDNIETTKLALSRALFCESIARAAQKGNLEEDAYVVGLFSLLDTMMEADFNSILCQLNLDERVKAALTKHEGFLGELLQFACAYENADWETVEAFIQTYGVDSELVGNIYYEAITNSDRLFSQASQDSKENS